MPSRYLNLSRDLRKTSSWREISEAMQASTHPMPRRTLQHADDREGCAVICPAKWSLSHLHLRECCLPSDEHALARLRSRENVSDARSRPHILVRAPCVSLHVTSESKGMMKEPEGRYRPSPAPPLRVGQWTMDSLKGTVIAFTPQAGHGLSKDLALCRTPASASKLFKVL